MTINDLIQSPEVAGHMLLVAFVFFILGLMVGDTIGFRAGIRIFTHPLPHDAADDIPSADKE